MRQQILKKKIRDQGDMTACMCTPKPVAIRMYSIKSKMENNISFK